MILAHKEFGFLLVQMTPAHEAAGWVFFDNLAAAKQYAYGQADTAEPVIEAPKRTRGRQRKEA